MFYPLKFQPILKEKIWGGNKLKTVLNKTSAFKKTGESWELSGLENNISIVSGGEFKGLSVNQLISQYKEDLLGKHVYEKFGNTFPLLIKFIDASDDLSVQVHPDDETAQKLYGENGKNELWYILDNDDGAELILGLKENTSIEDFKKAINNNTLTEKLNSVKVKKGDVFFIPAGRIHAVKKGILLAEIQQSSDTTYRIYDWNRKGLDGKLRELHINEACEVADLQSQKSYKSNCLKMKNEFVPCEQNQYFTVNILTFDTEIKKNYTAVDSFIIFLCTKGTFYLKYNNNRISVAYGETVLLPAAIKNVQFIPETESELLEIYIDSV